jgi:hypothetical protein
MVVLSRLCLATVVVGAIVGPAGCFVLDRADGLPSGTVTGVIVGNDGAPVASAVVALASLGRTIRADGDGRFRFRDVPAGGHVLIATNDVDSDGSPEEGAIRGVVLGQDPNTSRPVGLDVGDVRLQLTGSVSGRTVDDAAFPVGEATVAMWRSVEVAVGDGAPVVLDLAAEALVQTAADGTFRVSGLVAGDAFLAAFDSVADVATRGSTPQRVTVPPGADAPQGDVALDPLAGTRKARISFIDVEDDLVEVRLAPTGTPPVQTPTVTVQGAASVVIDVPFGVWDVYLKAGRRTAVLLGQVAPPLGPEEVSWGIASLVESPDVCGDGTVSGPEACDEGDANSDTIADACRTGCTLPSCGDTVVDTGEACDAGDANSDSAADACRTACALPSCGDAVTDTGEACDDGDANSDTLADACRTACTVPSCGDAVTDTGEVCDDGVDNAASCTPVGADGCGFCATETCTPGSLPSVATLTFLVTSVQGWGKNPLEGVNVAVAGERVVTDAAGAATVVLTLPLAAGATAIVGDHRDPASAERGFVRTPVPLPQTLVHDDIVTVPVKVLEGCAIDQVGQPLQGISARCPYLRQTISWGSNAGGLLVEGTVDPLPDDVAHVVRAAALTDSTFDDPTVAQGFPETRTGDGRLLRCGDLYDLRIDGADVNPDPAQGFLVFPPNPISNRIGDSAFFYDEAVGAFVEVPEAINGGDIKLIREGTWCLGTAVVADGCLQVSLDPAGDAVAGDVDIDVFDTSSAMTRISARVPAGGSVCVPVVSNSFPQVIATAADGRVTSGFVSGEVIFNADTCAAVASCAPVLLSFAPGASEGCVTVEPQNFQPPLDPLPPADIPASPITMLERREGLFYRGRFLFTAADPRRCVLVPSNVNSLQWEYPGFGDDCGLGFSFSTTIQTFRNLKAPPADAVCSDDGACETSLGDADFFCGS